MVQENVSSFKGIPVVILGVLALLGGVATFFLPNTNGKMADTIEEAEELEMEEILPPAPLSFLRKRTTIAKPAPRSYIDPVVFVSK